MALSTSTHRHSPQNIYTTFLTLFSLIPTRNRPTEEERMHTERRCSAVAALGRWQNTCVLSYTHTYTRTQLYIKKRTHTNSQWRGLDATGTGGDGTRMPTMEPAICVPRTTTYYNKIIIYKRNYNDDKRGNGGPMSAAQEKKARDAVVATFTQTMRLLRRKPRILLHKQYYFPN